MDRREFLSGSRSALFTAVLANLPPECGTQLLQAQSGDSKSPSASTTHQLTVANNPDVIAGAYRIGTKGPGSAATPYVYAFYDEDAQKFLNPLAKNPNGVKPSLPKGSYTMEPILHAFNIRQTSQRAFQKLKSEVQLSFNATAPANTSDQLSWIFMNAIDVFLAKNDKGRQDQLTKFTNSNSKNGTALKSTPKIRVDKGTVQLQITAYGQKQKSLWTTFFDIVAQVSGSTMISSASKGFGVPGLAAEAVTFVDGVLDAIAKRDGLVNLWQTGGLEFAVTTDATARFNMKPGLWVTIDSDYAQHSSYLDGHHVDLQFQSFRITDQHGKPVDANYLVADIKFPSS
jgi:hypothetical protein